jgi:carbon starvation protein
MAQILRGLVPGEGMMAFWYHYAILFEALFILTTIDAGTRIGRFMIQDLLGAAWAPLRRTESWGANLAATALCVAGWGYFLYQGVVDPLGGVNTLWPLFGISNQMLAGLALIFASVTLVKMKKERYLWITAAPMAWLLVCTLTAGWQKVFSADAKIGFLAHARRFGDALAQGQVLAPAKSLDDMRRVVSNDHVDAALALLFMAVVLIVLLLGVRAALRARRDALPTAQESPYVAAR